MACLTHAGAMSARAQDRFIWLEAVDRPRNVTRRYATATSEDLFGATIVQFAWGRIGTRGQSRTGSFADQTEAGRFGRQLLRRRAGAKARIGLAAAKWQCPSSDALPPLLMGSVGQSGGLAGVLPCQQPVDVSHCRVEFGKQRGG